MLHVSINMESDPEGVAAGVRVRDGSGTPHPEALRGEEYSEQPDGAAHLDAPERPRNKLGERHHSAAILLCDPGQKRLIRMADLNNAIPVHHHAQAMLFIP